MLGKKAMMAASAAKSLYVDDVMSTYLYTGTGAAQTITNGIDLAGEGGMVWVKSRSATTDHFLFDTVRGALNEINSNKTEGQASLADSLTAFNADGFSISSATGIGVNAATYASWTFRKAPKFFDVVTYTGTGSARTVAHNLGSVPGMIIVKRTDTTGDWQVYHRANTAAPETDYLVLNSTAATVDSNTRWNDTQPTSTVFSLGTEATVNASGGTYVAYLFAHDAGGFGESGTDNIVSCGSYVGNGSATGPVIDLGWEPQWVMIKRADNIGNWNISDSMRGIPTGDASQLFQANSSAAESTATSVSLLSTGFQVITTSSAGNASGGDYIYLAIRRPNKPPTSGAEVFSSVARTGTGANATVSGGFVTDTVIQGNRTSTTAGDKFGAWNRLRGTGYNITNTTAAEVSGGTTVIQSSPWDVMDGYKVGTTSTLTNASGSTFINWMFRRAAGFHDVVCYTGTGAARTVEHNLTVAPELMIVKKRVGSVTTSWIVYHKDLGATQVCILNVANAASVSANWDNTAPTSSVFSINNFGSMNTSGDTYVWYGFATLPGISKVGSYTGTGTASVNQINCGFTAGARFVLTKRTDSTGDWIVWDTARGIVSGNDPYLLLNSTAAEVTNTDWIDPLSSGFELSDASGNNANISGASYIFLAIA